MAAVPHPAPLPCPLRWIWDPNTIPLPIKVLAVVEILRGLRLSPAEMLITLLGRQTEYQAIADGFHRSQGLEHLLNVCNGNKLGAKKINAWFGTRGIEHLVQDTHREMDVLSTIFLQSTNEITPEGLLNFDFERDVTAVCEEHAPKLRRVLMAAAQTLRAARENTLKDPAPVVLFDFVTMIQAQLAKHRSQNNNLCAIPCSMYFLSSGMPQKVIDTLAHAGMSLSYDTTKMANRKLAVAQIGRACLAARKDCKFKESQLRSLCPKGTCMFDSEEIQLWMAGPQLASRLAAGSDLYITGSCSESTECPHVHEKGMNAPEPPNPHLCHAPENPTFGL
ncbi:hypothetical protein B0H13DRAFT_2481351 [Mycena leptocephala]|nr:hypothetical protein B0H13DRAFT_2481351 [Mycena leptocephala]